MHRLLALFCCFSCGLGNAAEKPPSGIGLNLLRPDSFEGWQYGESAPAGWTLKAGRLSGKVGATPLLSGWTFGDVQLRLDWEVSARGELVVSLPDVPSGIGIRIALQEGPACARITDGQRTLAPGVPLPQTRGQPHTAVVRRTGERLTVEVDGREAASASLAAQRRFGLGLAVAEGQVAVSSLRVVEPEGLSMVGRDLGGWRCPGNREAWKIDAGNLILAGSNGNYLRTEKEYGNFTLSTDYLVQKGGNSGFGIRTPREGWPSGDGMELQIWDTGRGKPLDEHSQMAIYGNVPPLARADRSEQWNRLVIKADGRMISAWVNGELVQHFNTEHHPELKRRHLRGWIGPQDHNARIEIRNLRILEAPDGTGLDAWHRAPAPGAAGRLLDRLVNSQRLAEADGIRANSLRVKVTASKEEQVLADLAGPGALVRVARTNTQGQLAFYFDGEARPRLEVKASDLVKAVPQVAEDANPVLTFLGYRQRLKITIREAKAGEHLLDFVTFPADLPLQSFSPKDSGVPRPWLSVVAYRHGQCWWGVHREHDPLPRPQSPQRSIKPGKTERLLALEGAGVVLWLKLRADKRVLEDDDLWLEVTVDGETRPAVAAPARYWFPGLARGGNYPNFTMTDRAGPTSLLAMPFARGLTIAASNRGQKISGSIGVTVSVEPVGPANEDAIRQGLRLRGVFSATAAESAGWLNVDGRGRLVGLVYQKPRSAPMRFESLAVDGSPQAGWSHLSDDLFLGAKGEFRRALSGCNGGLCWRYLPVEAVDFEKSLKISRGNASPRLLLYYGHY